MSALDEITGFHIEPTNVCTLKCEGCARTRFLSKWPQHWKNNCLNIDSLLSFLDIDLTGKHMNLCGNYGDPIYHNDFINFVAKLKQSGARITITTNGSYQSRNWWHKHSTRSQAGDHQGVRWWCECRHLRNWLHKSWISWVRISSFPHTLQSVRLAGTHLSW